MIARLAGGALLAVLLALGAMQGVRMSQSWSSVKTVRTPAGAEAPDFELPLLDGGTFKLSSARGDVVALAFWATWCEPCREELPQLDALAQKLKPSGVRFYAVNIESIDRKPSILKFRNGMRLGLPIVLDGEAASLAYHVETIPHLVILDRTGHVRDVLDGTHGMAEVESALRAAAQ